MTQQINASLDSILSQYQRSFTSKTYSNENDEHDLLMDAFGITPDLKRENRQYWGRELGMCWQLLVTAVCRQTHKDFGPPIRYGSDEPCDLTVGQVAIDTKYRIGSGDSGTLKKFKSYGPLLRQNGYEPVLLIVRPDNLDAAITACKASWRVLIGDETYDYLFQLTDFDIKAYLSQRASLFPVGRHLKPGAV